MKRTDCRKIEEIRDFSLIDLYESMLEEEVNTMSKNNRICTHKLIANVLYSLLEGNTVFRCPCCQILRYLDRISPQADEDFCGSPSRQMLVQ
jgi:hypothetical protein